VAAKLQKLFAEVMLGRNPKYTMEICSKFREDIKKDEDPWKYELSQKTNAEKRSGDVGDAFKSADAVVAASKPGPGFMPFVAGVFLSSLSVILLCKVILSEAPRFGKRM
jgi:hypothetical protein